MVETAVQEALEPLERLDRDIRRAAITLSEREVRYLVDYYYIMQEDRKRAANQKRALEEFAEPHEVVAWVSRNSESMERSIKNVLQSYAESKEPGQWALSIPGIGPIISSGLLAHVDITQCPTVGKIWRFGGLDPTNKWLGKEGAKKVVAETTAEVDFLGEDKVTEEFVLYIAEKLTRRPETFLEMSRDSKGKLTKESLTSALAKRPWNARLKLVCFHIGECLIRGKGLKGGEFYGNLFDQRKAFEWSRNLAGELSDQAAHKLETTRIGHATDAYHWYAGRVTHAAAEAFLAAEDSQKKPKLVAAGEGVPMLPPAHIHSRARRWLTKLFLAHYHEVAYMSHYGEMPPKPYVMDRLGHTDKIEVPNWPM